MNCNKKYFPLIPRQGRTKGTEDPISCYYYRFITIGQVGQSGTNDNYPKGDLGQTGHHPLGVSVLSLLVLSLHQQVKQYLYSCWICIYEATVQIMIWLSKPRTTIRR